MTNTIGEAIVEYLLSLPSITTLIDERLYPNVAPQDAEKPTLVYQLIDVQHVASRSGSSNLARSLFQFTCEAESYAEADELADAVRAAYEDYRNQAILQMRIDGAIIINELDEYSEVHVTHVVRLDVAFWHSEGIIIEQEATT
jgi:hypothetical protein